ncbi:MAG: NACHT domain-containing protein, partial [Bacteroidota bacterium]
MMPSHSSYTKLLLTLSIALVLHACAGSDFALPMLSDRKQHAGSAKPSSPRESSYVQELPYDPLAEAFNDGLMPGLLGGMEHADGGDEKSTTPQQDVKRTAAIRYGLVPQEIDRDGNCLEGTKLQAQASSPVRSPLTAANELLQEPELNSTTALVEALKDPDRKDHEVLRTILRQYNAWLQSDNTSRFTADHWLEYATLSRISPAQDNMPLLQQHMQVWKAKLSKSHLTKGEAVERFLKTINVTAIRDEKARQECVQQLKGLLSQKAWQADSFLTELLLSALYQIAKDHGAQTSGKQAREVLAEMAKQSKAPIKSPRQQGNRFVKSSSKSPMRSTRARARATASTQNKHAAKDAKSASKSPRQRGNSQTKSVSRGSSQSMSRLLRPTVSTRSKQNHRSPASPRKLLKQQGKGIRRTKSLGSSASCQSSYSLAFKKNCHKWFKTHSLPPHSNVAAQTDKRATAPSQTEYTLFTVVKTHLTEVHSRVDTQITEMMKTVATKEDLEQQFMALRKQVEDSHEQTSESRVVEHNIVLDYLEVAKGELTLGFEKSRQLLRGKFDHVIQEVGTGALQTQKAVRDEVRKATQSLQRDLEKQGGKYHQLLASSLNAVQTKVLGKLNSLQQVTATEVRAVFSEYGLAEKIDRIDQGVTELVQDKRKREQLEADTKSAKAKFVKEVPEKLKQYYKDHYAYIETAFIDEGKERWPIDKSYVQLAMISRQKVRDKEKKQEREEKEKQATKVRDHLLETYESIYGVKTDVKLEQLFENRKVQEGNKEVEKKVRKAFLIGRAGIGKTTICRKIAHLWATGQWYPKKFEAVYVLPVRALKKTSYNSQGIRRQENLETAIANECLPGMGEADYKFLTQYIEEQLKNRSSKVLIILDGLDEKSGASEEILRQVKDRAPKAYKLWVSRPYGITDQDHTAIKPDAEIENIGFSNEQVGQYTETYFKEKDARQGERLLKFLKARPAVYGIAHIPVNLRMLCSLWQGSEGNEAMEQAISGGMTGLYSELCKHVWRRYMNKKHLTIEPKKEEQEQLYELLGDIALAGLEKGELLIGSAIVKRVVEESAYSNKRMEALLSGSGFLRKTEQGERYFLHLTFQEYFAGRALAKKFLSKAVKDRRTAKKFLKDNKYKNQYRVMLTFMA